MSSNKEQEKSKRKKKSFKAWLMAPILAILAFLLALGDKFGIGPGIGILQNNSEPASAQVYAAQTPEEESAVQPAEAAASPLPVTSLRIEINEDKIIYEGKDISADELKTLVLEKNEQDFIWELWDNHAKKALYDQAKATLTECAVTFVEQ